MDRNYHILEVWINCLLILNPTKALNNPLMNFLRLVDFSYVFIFVCFKGFLTLPTQTCLKWFWAFLTFRANWSPKHPTCCPCPVSQPLFLRNIDLELQLGFCCSSPQNGSHEEAQSSTLVDREECKGGNGSWYILVGCGYLWDSSWIWTRVASFKACYLSWAEPTYRHFLITE